MKKDKIGKVLFIYQAIVIERRELEPRELRFMFGVTQTTVSNYIDEINNFLFDSYIYELIKYNRSKKTYCIEAL